MFKNAAEIFAYIKKEDVKLVDVRFTDLPGIQHHFNVPVESFDEAVFTDGLMFDGSSIRGFQTINESDMKLLPVPESAYIDPYRKEKTLIIIFSVHNPVDNTPYSRDPRGVVARAVDYMRSLGFADTAFFAPRLSSMSLTVFALRPVSTQQFTRSNLMKALGTLVLNMMQMELLTVVTAHV